jgi:hypothetical protein
MYSSFRPYREARATARHDKPLALEAIPAAVAKLFSLSMTNVFALRS